MNVILAEKYGFCTGVRRAVALAEDAALKASSKGVPCYVYGEIVHNRFVSESLEKKGILAIESPSGAKPGIIVIRAHGIGDDMNDAFLSAGFEIIDATCPVVLANGERLRKADGDVIVIGHKGHAEVDALLGKRDDASLIQSEDELEKLSPGCRYKAAVQTTFPLERLDMILSEASKRGIRIELMNSICPASVSRQKALEDIIALADAVVVAGDSHSSNSRALQALAASYGKPSFLVSSADDLPSFPPDYGTIALTAGASVPDVIIDAIREALAQYE